MNISIILLLYNIYLLPSQFVLILLLLLLYNLHHNDSNNDYDYNYIEYM